MSAQTTSAPDDRVVPAQPDAPGVPFPHLADDAYDAELEALAIARENSAIRAVAVVRLVAITASALLAFALRHDLRYALSPSSPIELGANPTTEQLGNATHRLVELQGIPGGVGAVDYRRPTSSGLFRLAPLVDRGDVYVELRLPDGVDPSRFVPPTTLRGHLVPFDEGGVRFSDARGIVERATGHSVPARTFLLEQGAEPTLRSPPAIVAVLALFVGAVQLALLASDARKLRRRAG